MIIGASEPQAAEAMHQDRELRAGQADPASVTSALTTACFTSYFAASVPSGCGKKRCTS